MGKGKRFGSKASAFQVVVQGQDPIRHPSTGDIIGHKKELVAEFAMHGKEIDVPGPDGSIIKAADIHGHFFDSAMQAEEKGWTDEERERVEEAVLYHCKRQPGQVWLIEEQKLAQPWPTYDETHHKSIPQVAQTVGMVAEALAYEKQNKDRAEVVQRLSELLAVDAEAAEAEQALTAA